MAATKKTSNSKKSKGKSSTTPARKVAPAKRVAKAKSPSTERVPPKQSTSKETVSARGATAKRAPVTRSMGPLSGPKLPASGPLTLEEARALAIAKRPQALTQRALAAAPAATPRSVAEEREELRQAQKAELARRLREYRETMAILKERGARKPGRATAPAGAGRTSLAATAAAAFVPLQIFAEGDSWFDYPAHAFKRGLVPRLEQRLGVPILNLAKAGDEVRYMLGVEQYKLLAEHLSQGCPAGGAWDVLLFSGGGNDIVDNPMALWVKHWNPALPAEDHLDTRRFASALSLVRAGYEDLIALRDQLSPTTCILFHGYDFAIPDGRGVCFNALGPWLKPTFDLRGFPTRDAGSAVVKAMLSEFAKVLQSLADNTPRVRFINGQGLLPEATSSWHNELHPSSVGFDRHADNFRAVLKELFPTRVS